METLKISVFNIIGDPFCAQAEDGQKIYKMIVKGLKEKKKIDVSFLNIELITSAFLNTAIGQLYGEFPEKKIKDSISVSDLSNEDKVLLKLVTDTAKEYYKDPQKMDKSINEIIGE